MPLQVAAVVKVSLHLKVSRRSRRASGERTAFGWPRFLATCALGGYLGRYFLSDPMDAGFEIVPRVKLDALATVDLIKSFFGGAAEPFELGFVFLLALLQEPEAFAHHFAGVAEPAGADAGLDEAVKVIR